MKKIQVGTVLQSPIYISHQKWNRYQIYDPKKIQKY